jgi:hypothetical protein
MLQQKVLSPRELDRHPSDGLAGMFALCHRTRSDRKDCSALLRHSRPQATKEVYIKEFDSDVIAAVRRMEETVAELRRSHATNQRQGNPGTW